MNTFRKLITTKKQQQQSKKSMRNMEGNVEKFVSFIFDTVDHVFAINDHDRDDEEKKNKTTFSIVFFMHKITMDEEQQLTKHKDDKKY